MAPVEVRTPKPAGIQKPVTIDVSPSKVRQVTFLPLGKVINATLFERGRGVREYRFSTKIDMEFAKLLVEHHEPGSLVYTEVGKDGRFSILAVSHSRK